jgi:hypothetical protein
MSDRLTAEPGTLEFLRQLLEIAQDSDHPMDKALTRVLAKQIGKTEAVRLSSPQAVRSSPQGEGGDNGQAEDTMPQQNGNVESTSNL